MPAVNHLKVDTTELRMQADRLNAAGAELHQGHMAAHGEVASIVTGFSGSPAFAAINELLAEWEGETNSQHKDLLAHSEGRITAAARYETGDQQSAQHIGTAAGNA